jgi:hypothetical protein
MRGHLRHDVMALRVNTLHKNGDTSMMGKNDNELAPEELDEF